MADNLRQRRGKKSGSTTSSAATETSPSNEGANGSDEQTPIDQLKSARVKLAISRDRTADLHAAWKSQLFLLSLLVVIVTVHQLQTSISACIGEIKDGDTNDVEGSSGGGGTTSGAEAAKLVFGDSHCELLGVVISSLLAYFLALGAQAGTAKMELDNWPYMVSSALVPVTLGLYFHSEQTGCHPEDIGGGNSEEKVADQRHQFPVVVIYHTIVTVAFWFMKSGREQCEEHVQLVDDSILDFERMEEKMKLKKQLKSRSRKK